MKKLVLFFAVVVAVSFASCGNKATATEEVEATPEVAPVVVEPAPAVSDSVPAATDSVPAAL